MQPYFKSIYGAIIPFSSVLAIKSYGIRKYDILLLSGIEVPNFTFSDRVDYDAQIYNYETWLVEQNQRSSNVNYIP